MEVTVQRMWIILYLDNKKVCSKKAYCQHLIASEAPKLLVIANDFQQKIKELDKKNLAVHFVCFKCFLTNKITHIWSTLDGEYPLVY